MSEAGDSPTCLNCGAMLAGQYCGQCGQRATSRLISVWELLRDAFGDLLELDSRLWRTLTPLLLRPGQLTKDYLEGRRARYMPPFRMYLVLSLIFFVVAFFDPRNELSILYEPEPEPASEEIEQEHAEPEPDEQIDKDGEVDVNTSGIDLDDDCNITQSDLDDAPEWVQRRFTEERLVAVCRHWKTVGGDGFVNALLDKVPASLIVLLPLMALVLKFLYPLSRRYYVEHLLFFVHFHAFFFLILTLQILFARLGGLIGFMEWLFTLIIVAA
ncbi:MAG: DUF3667 domain-containing protein, partial [Woeseiaceae bacterium]